MSAEAVVLICESVGIPLLLVGVTWWNGRLRQERADLLERFARDWKP